MSCAVRLDPKFAKKATIMVSMELTSLPEDVQARLIKMILLGDAKGSRFTRTPYVQDVAQTLHRGDDVSRDRWRRVVDGERRALSAITGPGPQGGPDVLDVEATQGSDDAEDARIWRG